MGSPGVWESLHPEKIPGLSLGAKSVTHYFKDIR